MQWPIKGLLGAAALLVLTSCGVSEDEAVRVRDGKTLFLPIPNSSNPDDPNPDPPKTFFLYCSTQGCPYIDHDRNPATEDIPLYCLEVFFEYGRSPPVCVDIRVCERLECEKEGKQCAIFEGFPGQVKCTDPR
jgi:hypothetical protein